MLGKRRVSHLKLTAQTNDERRSRRTDVRLPATLDAGPGRRIAATALNVSAHGVMLATEARLVPGRPVTVEMAGLVRTAGRVAWVRQGYVGVAFNTYLTLEEILAIV